MVEGWCFRLLHPHGERPARGGFELGDPGAPFGVKRGGDSRHEVVPMQPKVPQSDNTILLVLSAAGLFFGSPPPQAEPKNKISRSPTLNWLASANKLGILQINHAAGVARATGPGGENGPEVLPMTTMILSGLGAGALAVYGIYQYTKAAPAADGGPLEGCGALPKKDPPSDSKDLLSLAKEPPSDAKDPLSLAKDPPVDAKTPDGLGTLLLR